jgi:hypothetical protein
MDAIPLLSFIDPSLQNLDFLNANGGLTVPLDNLGPLTSNSDLNRILDSDRLPSAVPQAPCDSFDGVCNTRHYEESIKLLHRNSILSEYPFPPLVNCSSNDNVSSKRALPADSHPAPPKRRRRKRKAPLSEAEKEEKRMQVLERNRLAASKCRAKKKTEHEHVKERKRILERENPMLRGVLQELWDEVRVYRKAVMSHASCKHGDLMEEVGRNAQFSADLDARCQALLREEPCGEGLDRGGSPSYSIDGTAQTSIFSEDCGSERSSISSFTSWPASPTSARKDSVI